MKRNVPFMGMLAMVLVFGLVAAGCGGGKTINEIEPNDDYSEAQVIDAGTTVKGTIAFDDDETNHENDEYKVVLSKPGKLTVFTESKLDIERLDIDLLDEDGDWDDLIAEGDYIKGEKGDMRVEADLPAGTYGIDLKSFEKGPYKLITTFKASGSSASSKSSNNNIDKLLTDYEKFVNDYVALAKKAAAGDVSALSKAVPLMEKAEKLEEQLDDVSDNLTPAQTAKLLKIQGKFLNAF
jgi:hypothetical protein